MYIDMSSRILWDCSNVSIIPQQISTCKIISYLEWNYIKHFKTIEHTKTNMICPWSTTFHGISATKTRLPMNSAAQSPRLHLTPWCRANQPFVEESLQGWWSTWKKKTLRRRSAGRRWRWSCYVSYVPNQLFGCINYDDSYAQVDFGDDLENFHISDVPFILLRG